MKLNCDFWIRLLSHSLAIKVGMRLELGCLPVGCCLKNLQILALEQVRDQILNLLARDHLRVHKEELEVN